MPKAHLHLGRAFAAALILVPALFLARPTAAQGSVESGCAAAASKGAAARWRRYCRRQLVLRSDRPGHR